MINQYNDYLKTLSYRQLKYEETLIRSSIKRFKATDSQAVESLSLCQSLIKIKEKEIKQNGF